MCVLQITSLKKQIAQKEQSLLDKDKQVSFQRLHDTFVCILDIDVLTGVLWCAQICQLKAEAMDKEKELRQKLQTQQKVHSETVESLQVSRYES